MRNGKNNSCLFGEELIAYIYDELDPADRFAFEEHLVGCSGCIAEFADISLSRLGVFEWNRDEFLPLATPRFAIPYRPAATAARSRLSWIDSLRNLVSTPIRVAFAGGSLAVIAVAVGLAVTMNTKFDSELSIAVPEPDRQVIMQVPVRTEPQFPVEEARSRPIERAGAKRQFPTAEPEGKLRIVQAKAVAPRKKIETAPANARNAPRLGNFAEPEDTSLRLADLVADIDTND